MNYNRFFSILILVLLLTPTINANGAGVEVVGRSRVPALAVSMLENGSYVGTVSWIDVKILRPGSGVVYVSTEPLSDIDLQASARAAVLIASYLANKDPFEYDYLVSVKADSPIIGGPSAGSAMVAAIYAALTNTSLDPYVAATGMILPDGLIGPVGGVPEKAVAAASSGFKVILIPWGQSIYNEVRYVRQSIGPISIIRPESVSINVSDLVKGYGARVVEVATAEDLLSFFTDGMYTPSTISREPFLTRDEEAILSAAYKDLSALLNEALINVSSRSGSVKDQRVASYINNLVMSSNSYYNESKALFDRGLYYPALSSLFTSYYIARFAENLVYAYTSQDPSTYARNYISSVKSLLERYRDILKQYMVKSFYSVNELYILPEIYIRLYDAERSLNSSIASINSGDPISAIYYSSYSEARLESIDPWLQLVRLPSGGSLSRDLVSKIASWIYSYAETSLAYLESLLSSTGYQNPSSQELELTTSTAASLLGRGDYLGAVSLSISVILNTTLTIHNIFSINITRLSEIVRGEVTRSLAELGTNSPVSARLYAQMGDYLSSTGQSAQAVSLYEQSLLILRIAKLLANGSHVTTLSGAETETVQGALINQIPTETKTQATTNSPSIAEVSGYSNAPSMISTIVIIAIIIVALSAAIYAYARKRPYSD